MSGQWSGDRLELAATATGAWLTLDCGDGSIDRPVAPDRTGHFDAPGHLTLYRPGPQRADEPDADEPKPDTMAQFSGTIRGNAMTLVVTRSGAQPQTFHLIRGRVTKPVRCL